MAETNVAKRLRRGSPLSYLSAKSFRKPQQFVP